MKIGEKPYAAFGVVLIRDMGLSIISVHNHLNTVYHKQSKNLASVSQAAYEEGSDT